MAIFFKKICCLIIGDAGVFNLPEPLPLQPAYEV